MVQTVVADWFARVVPTKNTFPPLEGQGYQDQGDVLAFARVDWLWRFNAGGGVRDELLPIGGKCADYSLRNRVGTTGGTCASTLCVRNQCGKLP